MTAIQDKLVGNHCYGCGADNPRGMQIKSHWDGETSVCTYSPKPQQCAGPTTILYGGLIASLIDCHSVGTAIAHFYNSEGRGVGEPAQRRRDRAGGAPAHATPPGRMRDAALPGRGAK